MHPASSSSVCLGSCGEHSALYLPAYMYTVHAANRAIYGRAFPAWVKISRQGKGESTGHVTDTTEVITHT